MDWLAKLPSDLKTGHECAGCTFKTMAADYAGNEELILLSPSVMTIFLVCVKLDHFPVCSWLRMAIAYMKRRGNMVTTGWDDETNDDPPPRAC